MNADTVFDAPLWRYAGVALDEAGLQFDRAAHGIDHATELGDRAVAGALDDAAVMNCDGRVDQVAGKVPKAGEDSILIRTRKPRVADDVGHQNRRELPGLAHSSASPAFLRP